jgi:aryl-alcohol dehydrogenase-like predicted oxidoreductase
LLDFLRPYPVPEAALRYVLAHDVSTCCVGMASPDRLQANLRALERPCLDPDRMHRLRELFGRIQEQVR